MQSFTKCTKLTIKIQKTKMPSKVKCLFFCIFNILKKKMHGLISNLIYKILLCIKAITQVEYQAAKQTAQSTRTNQKMKNKEKYYAQKFNSKQVSCQPRESQQALQRPKKAQKSSNPTQQSLNQENKQGKVVYMTLHEKSAYIRNLQ